MEKTNYIIYGILFFGIFVNIALAAVPDSSYIQLSNSSNFNSNNIGYYFVNQDPDPVEPGDYVDVRWKVENFGSSNLDNVIIKIIPQYPFSLEPGQSNEQKIGSVYGRQIGKEGVIVHYRLKVDENAVEGNNEIKVSYSIDKGQNWNSFNPFYVKVQSRDIVLAIDSINSNPSMIKPGEKVNVAIKLKNLANSFIKNIKLNLQLITPLQTSASLSYLEAKFSPIGSSNEKVLSELKPREEDIVYFDLIADSDTKSGIYKIPLILTYSDKFGRNYSRTSLISLLVGDEPQLIVSFDKTDINSAETSGEISIKFVNKGVSNIKFLYVKLKKSPDYEILSNDDSYLGNIDSDDYETADFKIYVKKNENSTITLPIYLEYKDANNNDYAYAENIALRLYKSSELKKYGIQKKNGYFGIITVILILGIGFFLYRRWKKKK